MDRIKIIFVSMAISAIVAATGWLIHIGLTFWQALIVTLLTVAAAYFVMR